MKQRGMTLLALLGVVPLILALRPLDKALLAAASKGDLGEVTRAIEEGARSTWRTKTVSLPSTGLRKRGIKTLLRSCWTRAQT
jgi:hypothetical protein